MAFFELETNLFLFFFVEIESGMAFFLENHLRKVRKSEERKVKNKGKVHDLSNLSLQENFCLKS